MLRKVIPVARSWEDDPYHVLDLQDFAKSTEYNGRLSGRHPSSRFQEAIQAGQTPYNEYITADLPEVMGSKGTVISASSGEFDAISINDPEDDQLDAYDPGVPASITQAPTSTINPQRPRTIAAGYNAKTNIMTVVFRDGTWWNYTLVSSLEWSNFKRAYSKGRFLLAHGYQDGSREGGVGQAADVGTINEQERAILAMRSRAVQVHTGGLQQGQTLAGQKRALKRSLSYGQNLGGTGRARAKKG